MHSISVIICSYNRANVLAETLNSWREVEKSGLDIELIVVDNGSTDDTSEIVDSFQSSCSENVNYFCEKKAGLSSARNRGILEASKDIIAFADDDIYFDRNWVKALLKIFDEHPEVSCVGGKSIPQFEAAKPEWMNQSIFNVYGSTNSGEKEKVMVFPEHPYGLNMAFRKSVFENIGDFNPELGRIKNCLASNEEVEIFYRVNKAGFTVYYAPKAVVFHRIPKNRVNKSWLIRRYYWQGRSDVIFSSIYDQDNKRDYIIKIFGLLKRLVFPIGISAPVKNIKYYTEPSFKNELETYKLVGMLKQYIDVFFKNCS
ncbi:hypothetical protein DSCW_50790 [Desulfosarcina widdelii]|uniref:Glycosyltransferase 2-like domain-containing protein n=1 Tax=Desulfosarcina widdelii TaxID=947919 RepID=A0A5K7Z6M8_9BACT|nr:glycosyltransferase [Desulfosarcina widdelii]BBO77662.1 hypothetical protein DSCW_50790 [Desulfosarcina widdelii]